MRRRLSALLLTLAFLLGSLPVRAASSMDNFRAVRTYDGRFTDVAAGDWYYPSVVLLYRLGLTEGRSASRFGAAEAVTVEEVAVFAARIRSVYATGDPEAGPAAYPRSGRWSEPYAAYLRDLGVLGSEFDNLSAQPATRAQAAGILARALPAGTLPEINGSAVTQAYALGEKIPDVTAYTPYQQEILSLYRWGVVEGTDADGRYCPDQTIRRRELAAILARLVEEDLRLTLDWGPDAGHSAAGTTLADLVDGDTFHRSHELEDLEAIDDNVRWMLARNQNTLSLVLGPGVIDSQTAGELVDRYLNTVRHYIEQGYNAIHCTYRTSTGAVTLTFSSGVYGEEALTAAREGAMEAAVLLHDHLWQTGQLTERMTETEKARVYFTWLTQNCAYDFDAAETSPSHTAYGLFRYGLAVCDGYTAAYNLLLKLEGIRCSTRSVEDHIWTVAVLDGKTVHSDVTWGDQGSYAAYQYFNMTEAAALARF